MKCICEDGIRIYKKYIIWDVFMDLNLKKDLLY